MIVLALPELETKRIQSKQVKAGNHSSDLLP